MITCQHARHLFGRYLDGELSPSLQAELHAHQLNCVECQSELAMFEACGAVVALDRREPTPSASFTDRVLLARRAQLARRPRQWRRVALLAGSPMAAAASVAFAVMLILPNSRPSDDTVIAAHMLEAPAEVSEGLKPFDEAALLASKTDSDTGEAREKAAGFVDTMLAPVVDQTLKSVHDAQRGVQEFELLMKLWALDTNEQLAAEWHASSSGTPAADETPPGPGFELELLPPTDTPGDPVSEPARELFDPV